VPEAVRRGEVVPLCRSWPPESCRESSRRQWRDRTSDHGGHRPSDIERGHAIHQGGASESARQERHGDDGGGREGRINREQKCPENRTRATGLDKKEQKTQ